MRKYLIGTHGLTLLAAVLALAVTALAWRADNRAANSEEELNRTAFTADAALLEAAFAGFLADLTRFTAGDALVDQLDISRHVDLVIRRVKVLEDDLGDANADSLADHAHTLALLHARLLTHEAYLLDLDRTATGRNEAIVAAFTRMQGSISEITAAAVAEERGWRDAAGGKLKAARYDVRLLALTLSGFTIFLFALAMWHRNRAAHDRKSRHAMLRRARTAEGARSRFLSMMSHELRTPMNGVLGMVQLLKQSPLNENQSRIVDQVERSGSQMTDLLGDILDYSDLAADRLEIAVEPFQPVMLVGAIEELLSAAATRHRTPVSVTCAAGAPEWVSGDFPRLRQALSHMAGNLVADERVRSITLMVAHDRGQLVCTFAVRTILAHGRIPRDDLPGLAPETLGLTIASGLIGLMGGEIDAQPSGRDLHEVAIRLPAPIQYPQRDLVRIEEHSETTGMLLRRAVADAGLKVWSPSRPEALVTIILLELPLDNEGEAVGQLRSAHPKATLIGIGSSAEPEKFDRMCTNAMDVVSLQAALTAPGDVARAG